MDPLKIVLPAKPQKVTIAAAPREAKPSLQEDYQGGFDAGYKAGLWKAQLETEASVKQQAEQMDRHLKSLTGINQHLLDLLRQHLPEIILTVLNRVMEHHQFSAEEIGKEIEVLLRELGQASSVTIECASEDLSSLREQMDRLGLSLPQGYIDWKLNPQLHRGEFRLISDLGTLDGRHLVRLAEVSKILTDAGKGK